MNPIDDFVKFLENKKYKIEVNSVNKFNEVIGKFNNNNQLFIYFTGVLTNILKKILIE